MDNERQNKVKAIDDNFNIMFALLRVILKNKWIFVASIAVCLGIAGVHISSIPTKYECKTTLEIGCVAPNSFIQQPAALTEAAKAKYKDKNVSITLDKTTNLISISSVGSSAEEAKQLLMEVANDIIMDHQRIFSENKAVRQKYLKDLEDQLNTINNLLPSMASSMKSSNPSDLEKGELLLAKAQITEQIAKNKMEVNEVFMRPTKMLIEPTTPTARLSPRPEYEVVVAIIVGCVFGLFGGMCADFYTRRKGQKRVEHHGN